LCSSHLCPSPSSSSVLSSSVLLHHRTSSFPPGQLKSSLSQKATKEQQNQEQLHILQKKLEEGEARRKKKLADVKAKATRETQKVKEVAFINEHLTAISKMDYKTEEEVRTNKRIKQQLQAQKAKIRDQVRGK
jgi:hypothetical protein